MPTPGDALDNDAASAADTASPSLNFCDGQVQAIHDPAKSEAIAFPSNFYTVDDPSTHTGIRLHFIKEELNPREQTFRQYPDLNKELNQLDGFGTIAGVIVHLTAPFDTALFDVTATDTVSPSSPVMLIDVDAKSPDAGKAVPVRIVPRFVGQKILFAEPLFPLRPKTTYAFAVRSVNSPAMGCLAPSEATRTFLRGEASGKGWDRLNRDRESAVAALRDKGFIRSVEELAYLTIYTTQSIEEDIRAIVEDVENFAKTEGFKIDPASMKVEVTGTCPIAVKSTGTFNAYSYQNANGLIEWKDGKPVRQKQPEPLRFDFWLPCETETVKAPFPVSIEQHGLNGDRGSMHSKMARLAPLGVAMLSIDAPSHGYRNKGVKGLDVIGFFAVNTQGARQPFNMLKARDNFREAYAELLMLSRLAAAGIDLLPAGAPDGKPEIQAKDVMYIGHSLGGILGTGYMAMDRLNSMGVLVAGGGGLTNILLESALFGTFIKLLAPPNTTEAQVQAFFPVLQTMFEKGDPGNLAHLIHRNPMGGAGPSKRKHVLFQAVEQDTYVPNLPNELLGRALGIPLLQPVLHPVPGMPLENRALPVSANSTDGLTAGYFQFDIQNRKDKADHSGFENTEEARTQWLHWYKTWLEKGSPELIDPYKTLGVK
ncbi:MAG: hypothetical protein GMKNLPBB_00236 [Myxococcota bacterium]|nr:hypothetical protein [Myxococcota bacterium]